MWSDQTLKDAWENLDDVAYRLRRGNTHYHNMIEILAVVQDLLKYSDQLRARLEHAEEELRYLTRRKTPTIVNTKEPLTAAKRSD